MKRLYSGIQPTGDVHLGNYEGALKNWTRLQTEYESFFGIVDLHAMTIDYAPEQMRERTLRTAAWIIACGVDPERAVIYPQSAVPEHSELAWILFTLANMGQLERMTQYKDKSRQHEANINLGLFAYPVLQSADILLYKGEVVPVGEDQLQHLELSRVLARRFNHRFGETFPEPQPVLTEAKRILGLDAEGKMSKSKGNSLDLIDDPDARWEKLKTAKTDERRKRLKDPGEPEDCNIFSLHKLYTPREQRDELARQCRAAEIGCFACKKVLEEHLAEELDPIRERFIGLMDNPGELEELLRAGTARASAVARSVMEEVREKTGLLVLS